MDEANRLKRCVFAPVLLASEEVSTFRKRFDSLYGKCPPHVTLVFPFVTSVDTAVVANAMEERSVGRGPLDIIFLAPELMSDCVVLPLASANPWFQETHERLSTVAGSTANDRYRPHVTIGRNINSSMWVELDLRGLSGRLPSRIERLVLEEIQPDDSSRILHEIDLCR